jgi:hypothetical protein
MKKLLFSLMVALAAFYPVFSQQVTEEVPEESLTLKKGNIPPAVVKAAQDLFQGSTQIKWGVFPYELKDYGWVVNKNYNEPIDHYEIYLKTKNGGDVFAVLESTGELIRYRMIDKNASLPSPILKAIAKTGYKDWKIAGDTEKVTSSQKKVDDHYIVRLEKGGQKKTLYYTLKGEEVTNR